MGTVIYSLHTPDKRDYLLFADFVAAKQKAILMARVDHDGPWDWRDGSGIGHVDGQLFGRSGFTGYSVRERTVI